MLKTILILAIFYIISCIKIVKEYERAVIFRLGRVLKTPKGPGIFFVLWPIDKMVKASLRTVTLDVPPQDIITKDNVSVKVNAVVYYRIMDPIKAVIEVEDYDFATSQISQTTLRSVVGQAELDELLSNREKINLSLQEIIDKQTDPWGVKVSVVEIKHVDLPAEMQRAMARQAEAERERRAKIIAAEGEFQAADKLRQAAEMIKDHPIALQMRYLQTLVEMSSERSSTIVFPLPLEFLKVFAKEK
ncbi:MAG TPA: slipin family protein [Candidatus Omnitrophica bacterium]|nr:MAG: slipin family protein [Candidatus Omnitrophota bacterium]RKY43692.1 MAG: slipin family protein [Candidatus Omnitrophota bacterium]HEC70014.1 slipin family protein [Candidatus Omnitrophota bacterium]